MGSDIDELGWSFRRARRESVRFSIALRPYASAGMKTQKTPVSPNALVNGLCAVIAYAVILIAGLALSAFHVGEKDPSASLPGGPIMISVGDGWVKFVLANDAAATFQAFDIRGNSLWTDCGVSCDIQGKRGENRIQYQIRPRISGPYLIVISTASGQTAAVAISA